MILVASKIQTILYVVLLVVIHSSVFAQVTPTVIKTFWGPIKHPRLGSEWVKVREPDYRFGDIAVGDYDFGQPDQSPDVDYGDIRAVNEGREMPPIRDSSREKQARDFRRTDLRPHIAYEVNLRGVDPMVAVGRNFMMASQQGSVAFLDKKGKPLPEKQGIPSRVSSGTIFSAFIDTGGEFDINKFSNFPKACDSPEYPATAGNKFCVGNVYDTRVYFDALGDRFVIVAQMRNQMATEVYKEGWKNYTDKFGACGTYKSAAGVTTAVPDPAYCSLTRRHMVFAVSKTEDPRDGFHIYAITENNYRDWPWGSVNAESGVLVLGSGGTEMDDGPALSVFSLEDLRAGKSAPRYYKYLPSELGTRGRSVAPIVHHGASVGLGGRTLALTVDRDESDAKCLKIITLPAPTGQGDKPPPVMDCFKVDVPEPFSLPGWLAATVYRNGYLHMTWSASFQKTPDDIYVSLRKRVHVLRIPVQVSNGRVQIPKLTLNTPGYRFLTIDPGTAGAEMFRRDFAPAISVNAKGDLLVSFARAYNPYAEIEVHYMLWPSDETQAPAPEIVRYTPKSGTNADMDKIDYSWSAVDPVDDLSFWFAQDYRWSKSGQNNTLLVRVND